MPHPTAPGISCITPPPLVNPDDRIPLTGPKTPPAPAASFRPPGSFNIFTYTSGPSFSIEEVRLMIGEASSYPISVKYPVPPSLSHLDAFERIGEVLEDMGFDLIDTRKRLDTFRGEAWYKATFVERDVRVIVRTSVSERSRTLRVIWVTGNEMLTKKVLNQLQERLMDPLRIFGMDPEQRTEGRVRGEALLRTSLSFQEE